MRKRLIDYIRKPDTLDAQAIEGLRELIEKYPFYHAACILYLQGLYKGRSSEFDKELRRYAPLIPNRQAVFNLVERKNYLADEERRKFGEMEQDPNSKAKDHTTSLIDNFLNTLPPEPKMRNSRQIDATQDYIGYLMQFEDAEEKMDADTMQEKEQPSDDMGIIEEFLEKDQRIQIRLDEHTPKGPQPEMVRNDTDNEILTETLAHIYIKQGKFEKAVEILQRISLKYPKKNRYFADQIRFLEKLIINSKNNKS